MAPGSWLMTESKISYSPFSRQVERSVAFRELSKTYEIDIFHCNVAGRPLSDVLHLQAESDIIDHCSPGIQ
jgi:hypothetical protein